MKWWPQEKRKRSELELILLNRLVRLNVPPPVEEHYFALPDRRWRFDFAWPDYKLAVEVEGGSWIGGRHSRGAGFQSDIEKYNSAARLGWTVLRYTGRMIEQGPAAEEICAEVARRVREQEG
jgi:hypothetical protein